MLTARREKFAQECASGKTATDAYRAAFTVGKMSDRTLWTKASYIYNLDDVRSRIEELRTKVIAKTEELFTLTHAQIQSFVLQDAWEVANADSAELITYKRINCRHCHGTNFAYRWKDEKEFWAALATASAQEQRRASNPKRYGDVPIELPTDEGGYGFRKLHMPNPKCPECEGEGIEMARVADVQSLSGPARRLFNGVKVKRDGSIEVVLRDKEAARALLAKHAGMIDDRVKLSGLVGLTPVMQVDPAAAAAIARTLNDEI